MKNARVQTIPKEKLSGGYAVNIYRPLYKDYSQAMKLYPAESRENPNGPGYTFEEFLCALCIRDANGAEVDNAPKDAIERFAQVQLKDKQYISRTFITAFLMTQDLQDEAEALADTLMDIDPYSLTYTITKDQLPWGSADFTFHRPSSSVQISVTKNYTSPRVNGCAWEEMFLVSCMQQINGEALPETANPISHFYDLEVLDVQFVAATFIKMFSMGMNERKDAMDLGKSWRTKISQPSPDSKPKSASLKAPTPSTT
jgi:hypothetical protein